MKLQFRWVLCVDFAVLTFCCFCSSGSCAIARDSTTVNLANFPQERKVSSGGEDTSVSLFEITLVFQGQEDNQQVTHKHNSTEKSQKKQIIKLFCCCLCAVCFSTLCIVALYTYVYRRVERYYRQYDIRGLSIWSP